MARVSNRTRNEAKAQFVKGETLAGISEKHGVSINTVKKWYNSEKWALLRRETRKKADETILAECEKNLVENTKSHLRFSKYMIELVSMQAEEIGESLVAYNKARREANSLGADFSEEELKKKAKWLGFYSTVYLLAK